MRTKWHAVAVAGCIALGGWLIGGARVDAAPSDGAPGTAELVEAITLHGVANGVAKTPSGRTFLPLSRLDGSLGPQLVEWKDGRPVPFPDQAWNSPGDPSHTFVRVNAARIGPDGALWVVDVGSPSMNGPALPHGPKIVRIDLSTNTVSRVYALDGALTARSAIDDIRFHGRTAYITDAGSPGIIVLDLDNGVARRALDGDPSATAQRPITADDHVLRGIDGKPIRINADQLEVSPDGKFFYFQPASGPLSRIATRYLDDPKLPPAQLSKHVSTFARTPSTGGTAIDATGTIYLSDVDHHRILAIDASGAERTIVEDPRLDWVDAMWIDDSGWLYMPAAQLDRMAPFNGGVSAVQWPVVVYKMQIGAKPSPIDHP